MRRSANLAKVRATTEIVTSARARWAAAPYPVPPPQPNKDTNSVCPTKGPGAGDIQLRWPMGPIYCVAGGGYGGGGAAGGSGGRPKKLPYGLAGCRGWAGVAAAWRIEEGK